MTLLKSVNRIITDLIIIDKFNIYDKDNSFITINNIIEDVNNCIIC